MARYNANALIKELRKAQGMTQEKLAEGICSRHTITKIESGERKADWFILQNVLIRLGVKFEDLQSRVSEMLSGDEAFVVQKRDELQKMLSAFDNAGAKALLDELAEDRRFTQKSQGGYQIYLRFMAAVHLQGQYKDIHKSLECATECIKINRPDFDIDKLADYFLSPDELTLLNMIAIAYAEIEGMSRAIEIWFMLKANYEKQYNLSVHENPRYRELVLNICVGLKNAERFEECLAIAEEGLKSALANNEMRTHIIYFRQKAWCLMKLGRADEGRELYKKFLMLAYVMDGYASVSFEMGKKEYEDTFGEQLELCAQW